MGIEVILLRASMHWASAERESYARSSFDARRSLSPVKKVSASQAILKMGITKMESLLGNPISKKFG